ncbi:MAG: hypothetical protein WA726_02510 [Acidimicrobiia bacterium]
MEPSQPNQEADSRRDGRLVAGVILVVVGIGLFAAQFVEGLDSAIWLISLGVLFTAGYFYRHSYGLLIPGGILFGIGLGQVGDQVFDGFDGSGSIGLGLGFVLIYLIDRLYRGSIAPWWPLIPGGILLITGLANAGEPFSRIMDYAWPAILIIIGVAILLGVNRARDRS